MKINGIDVNEKTQELYRTPLMLACKNGHLLVARFLIDYVSKEDLQSEDLHQKTALDYSKEHKGKLRKELLNLFEEVKQRVEDDAKKKEKFEKEKDERDKNELRMLQEKEEEKRKKIEEEERRQKEQKLSKEREEAEQKRKEEEQRKLIEEKKVE